MARSTILIIEDDPGIVELCQTVLEDQGYRVVSTSNLKQVAALIEDNQLHLIFIDLHLNSENSEKLIQSLKSEPETKKIPLILFSANRNAQEIAVELGADACLRKPFNLSALELLASTFCPIR